MEWWGSDEFISTTRKGTWWQLSAILYGDPDADLFQHLRAFKPELSPFRRGRAQFYTEPTELGPLRRSRYVPNSK
jgi:hypothetical protein